PGDDASRFRHLRIRAAAYDALPPKATRAELHQRFAAWLAEYGSSLVELEEILGYHLEQAALPRRARNSGRLTCGQRGRAPPVRRTARAPPRRQCQCDATLGPRQEPSS